MILVKHSGGQKKGLIPPKCQQDRVELIYGQLMQAFLFSARLAVCEKALAEYLETKRLAFPRFYFVSSADLLDILSKGTEPLEV